MNKKCIKKCISLIFTIFLLSLWAAEDTFVFDSQAKTAETETIKPELVLQTGHNYTISAVVFSPDNKWIASGSFDNTIKIWESATGRELRVLNGHSGAIKALAWNQNWLASGGNDKTVKLWNVETGQEIHSFDKQNEVIEVVAFSPNGQVLAFGGGDQTIKIRETSSGRELKTLPESGDNITALAFSPDGLFLACGNSDNTIKIWEINKNKKPRILKKHTDRIKSLVFSPDGQFLASGGFDTTVRIWKTSNGRELHKFTGHTDKILALNFLSGDEIVSADINHTIKFWNPATGRAANKETSADNLFEAESTAFSSDGRLAVFGYGDRTASLFDTTSGRRIENLENHTSGFNSIAFSSDKHWLAVGSLDNTVKLWDLQTGQSLPPLADHIGYIKCVVFHPDKRRIISASLDHTIKIWDFTKGGKPQTLDGHKGAVSSIAVSRQGNRLVSGSFDGTIKIWDLSNGTETRTFSNDKSDVTSVAISPDEKLIASGSVDNTVKIWDLSGSKEPQKLAGHLDTVQSVAFSPDGKLLASASSDKTIKIWDISSGRNLLTLSGHTGKITTISFSPDGKRLVSGSEDKTIKIWNLTAGNEEKSIADHTGTVNSAAFNADGKWLASASDDGSVIIRRGGTAEKLATLLSLRENNDWLVVSPKGFFDGSPTAWNQLLWRFSDNTFNVSPVEVFFNEFYQPGLLADLLEGKQLDTMGDISKKDRRQPQLGISLANKQSSDAAISERNIRLKIEIAEAAQGSGAQDVRLFRNGSLVEFWEGNVLTDKNNKIELEATVPIVSGQNQFTAYAFNRDNIKSSDANLTVVGTENLKRAGMTYIVAVGIGKYANPEFNLSYIDADVKDFSEALQLKQSELNVAKNTKIFMLQNEQATKSGILETLKGLASTDVSSTSPFGEPVQPEDSVIVYFSGHGISEDNRFYMIPYDLGYRGKRADLSKTDLKNMLSRSISDIELEEAFRGIDAKNLLLVIDACNSGQALETVEKRRGPMNSKGLAQLAYEKGMYILTASQSVESAYNSQILEHSYLTYALIEEGLKTSAADNNPADGQLLLREWFDYASVRVPLLREEVITNSLKKEQIKGLKEVTATVGAQRPRVFYRRQTEQQPMVVARFATNN